MKTNYKESCCVRSRQNRFTTEWSKWSTREVIFIGAFINWCKSFRHWFKSSKQLNDLFKVKWSACGENIQPTCCLLGNKTRRVYEGQTAWSRVFCIDYRRNL